MRRGGGPSLSGLTSGRRGRGACPETPFQEGRSAARLSEHGDPLKVLPGLGEGNDAHGDAHGCVTAEWEMGVAFSARVGRMRAACCPARSSPSGKVPAALRSRERPFGGVAKSVGRGDTSRARSSAGSGGGRAAGRLPGRGRALL